MSLEARVRVQVARYVWASNPHSAELAVAVVRLAALLDAGDDRWGVRNALRLALAHLRACDAVPDEVDRIRASYCRRLLESMTRPPSAPAA